MPEVLAVEGTGVGPITVGEFPQEQADDPFCKQPTETAGQPRSQCDHDGYGFLVQISALIGMPQPVVLSRLRARVLYLTHYSPLAGHPGGSRIYYTIRREDYWPQMATGVFSLARNIHSCTETRAAVRKDQKHPRLYPAGELLEFVPMDLLGSLPKKERRHQFVMFITDWFSRLARFVLLQTTMGTAVANAFFDY